MLTDNSLLAPPCTTLVELTKDETYVAHEKEMLNFWKSNNTYLRLKSKRQSERQSETKSNVFDFMDGPPFVSGMLHLGHFAVGSIKDTTLRYKYMHGMDCPNRLGYDCHGLPIESIAMRDLNLKSISDIKDIGVETFNQFCRDKITEFSGSWEPAYEAIGRQADFTNVYKTMDINYMESVWWAFKTLYEKGLIYRGYKIMPYSYSCETPLSNFEAGENYKEIDTNTLYVCFPLKIDTNINIVAWTTTPWTLPSNIALCVNPDATYVLCSASDYTRYVVSEESIDNLKLDIVSVSIFGKGKNLVGLEYIPPYNYLKFTYHKILADDYVQKSGTTGTGIVHIAPAFGEDDFRICVNNNIITSKDLNMVMPVTSTGCFTSIVSDYAGELVFDTSSKIIKELKSKKLVVRVQQYKHQYPHCPRKDTPLIYMGVTSYFVDVHALKNDMIRLNDKINWTKKEVGMKRFRNWLEQAKDWGISRNRIFGNPIPVWMSDDGTETVVIGSVKELLEYTNLDIVVTDIHSDTIDKLTIISKTSGKQLHRVNEVLDCWFESGCVPFAQIHYPFENTSYFDDKEYLSDFIAEGLDQTRGWFYTLLVLSTALFDKPPSKTILCTGLILDKDGLKFSKKYGNFVDPYLLINKYGADAIRLYLLKSPLINADPLCFNENELLELMRRTSIPIINGLKFFLDHYLASQKMTTVPIVEYVVDSIDVTQFNMMDLWILERVSKLRKTIELNMELYQIDASIREIVSFIEDMTNWYIKLNRYRMKGIAGLDEMSRSLSTLLTVLFDFTLIVSPFIPFLSEYMYQHLVLLCPKQMQMLSVHGMSYPNVDRAYNMNESFEQLQKISRMIRALRDSSKTHTSIKTPIKKCIIYHYDQRYLDSVRDLIDLINDEINCLDFEFTVISDNMIGYKLKLNHGTIGKRFRGEASETKSLLENITHEQLEQFYNGSINEINITLKSGNVNVITKDHISIEMIVKMNDTQNDNMKISTDENLLLCVDFTHDEECVEMCKIKNIISFVQNMRKKYGLKPWNKIMLAYSTTDMFTSIIEKYSQLLIKKLGCEITKHDTTLDNIYPTYVDSFSSDGESLEIHMFVIN